MAAVDRAAAAAQAGRIAALVAWLEAGGRPRPGWQATAACRGAPITLFFRPAGMAAGPAIARYCHGCPAQLPCGAEGLVAQQGTWGGITNRQLRRTRTRLRPATLADLATYCPPTATYDAPPD